MRPNDEMTKTGNFENDVRSGYYRWERNREYEYRGTLFAIKTTWDEDFRKFLLDSGVPTQYLDKVAYVAWDNGHYAGEEEILNFSYDLISIFK